MKCKRVKSNQDQVDEDNDKDDPDVVPAKRGRKKIQAGLDMFQMNPSFSII